MSWQGWRGVVVTVGLLGLAGCAARPAPRSVWIMPGATPRGQGIPPGAPGYTWVYASRSSQPASQGQPRNRGDLPESGRGPRDALWQGDETQARRLAQQLNRLIVIDFYADWCEPCVHMAVETFAERQLRATLRNQFVTMQVDVTEETMANREQLKRYGVSWLPTMLVVAPDGEELERIDRFISAADLTRRLAALQAQHEAGSEPHAHAPHD